MLRKQYLIFLLFSKDGFVKMYVKEGLRTLWSGTVPSLVLVSNPAIKFTAYETLKRKLLESRGSSAHAQLDAGQAFALGVAASLMATIVTYPIQVVQTKSRVSFGGMSPPG